MPKPKRSSVPLQAPQYRGGKKALLKFIQDNLKYPEEALNSKIEGIVEISYVVNGLGKVIETKVIKGIGHGCDEEAVRLVKSLVFEKVYNRGLNTKTNRSIKIDFRLPRKKPISLNYQVVKEKKSTPLKSKTYTMTLNIPKK